MGKGLLGALGSVAGFATGGIGGALLGHKAATSNFAQEGAAGEGGAPGPANVDFSKESDSPALRRLRGMAPTAHLQAEALPSANGGHTAGYEQARTRALSAVGEQNQGAGEAIQRRFAAQGGLNSGAAIKSMQIADQQGGERRQKAAEGIDLAEMDKLQGLDEATKGRNFQRETTNAGIDNANFDRESKIGSLDLQTKDAQASQQNNAFNAYMQKYQQKHSGGLFGSGGMLGLGI